VPLDNRLQEVPFIARGLDSAALKPSRKASQLRWHTQAGPHRLLSLTLWSRGDVTAVRDWG
jgi:hypothetical protein